MYVFVLLAFSMIFPVLSYLKTTPTTAWKLREAKGSLSRLFSSVQNGVSLETVFSVASTIKEAHNLAKKILESNGVIDSDESSRHILSHLCQLGTRYSDFQNSLHKPIADAAKAKFSEMIRRRLDREPIQYIIGEWDFYGATYLCKQPVLIPRPETEELVDHVYNAYKDTTSIKFLDIGSGSGVIGISLLNLFREKCNQVTAIDINMEAVALSKENADRLLNPSLRTKYVGLLSPISDFGNKISNFQQYDVIISNPPYIPSREIPLLQTEVVKYEDAIALDGGEDGLTVVRQILMAGKNLLSTDGFREIWLEVSEEHPQQIHDMCNGVDDLEDANKVFRLYSSSGVISDVFGKNRFNRLKLR